MATATWMPDYTEIGADELLVNVIHRGQPHSRFDVFWRGKDHIRNGQVRGQCYDADIAEFVSRTWEQGTTQHIRFVSR